MCVFTSKFRSWRTNTISSALFGWRGPTRDSLVNFASSSRSKTNAHVQEKMGPSKSKTSSSQVEQWTFTDADISFRCASSAGLTGDLTQTSYGLVPCPKADKYHIEYAGRHKAQWVIGGGKTARWGGKPGNHFWRPSENCFWGGYLRQNSGSL